MGIDEFLEDSSPGDGVRRMVEMKILEAICNFYTNFRKAPFWWSKVFKGTIILHEDYRRHLKFSRIV